MDWSPSHSVDYYNHPDPYSSTDNTPADNDGVSDSTTMLDFCYPSRDYGDSSERIANMTMIKLQRASAGRQQCLLRQVQLTRMLHRIRFQAFLRPVLGYDPSGAFDQDLSSPPTLDTSESHPPLDPIRYEWDQALGPNQLASALSLDMLLSMGSSSSADPSTDSSSCPASSSLASDQGMFSLVPLVSFANEFLDPSSRQQELSSIPSSLPSTVSSPMAPSSHHQQQPLTPSYYELLMANPNEPLSQLMSTNATSINSPSFTATCSSMDHLSTFSISTPTPTPTSTSTPAASSSSSPTETNVSTNIPRSDQQLASTSTPFQLTAYPIDHSGAPSSDASRSAPQTVPLTTKEIMDALSGQLPIQPLTPTEIPFPMVPQPLPSATTVITTTSTSPPSYESIKSPYTQESGTTEISSWEGDRDMLSPPPHFQEASERTEESESVIANPSSETSEADVDEAMDVDEANVAMTSPPSSPPAAMGRSSRRRSSSRPSTRRSTRGNRSGSLGITDANTPEPSTTGDRWRKPRSRSPKRRRMSEEDVSYCSESSPESCPASPKTPPPMDHHAEGSFQHEHGLDHDHGCEDGHPKRRRSDATEEAGLMSVAEIVDKVVQEST
ncbi:hypothetical protein BGZ92_005219, partial [Podila epicladia]